MYKTLQARDCLLRLSYILSFVRELLLELPEDSGKTACQKTPNYQLHALHIADRH